MNDYCSGEEGCHYLHLHKAVCDYTIDSDSMCKYYKIDHQVSSVNIFHKYTCMCEQHRWDILIYIPVVCVYTCVRHVIYKVYICICGTCYIRSKCTHR